MPSIRHRETVLWSLVACSLLILRLWLNDGPVISSDSYQYLSIADNFLAGRFAETSIVHFDVERGWGTIPAPITTFPFGYPLVVSIVSLPGIDVEDAALVVSALSLVLLVPLLAWAARLLSFSAFATRFILVGLLANSWSTFYGSALLSESLFTLIVLASVVCFIAAVRHGDDTPDNVKYLILANGLLGLSYWVRYAGLLIFAAVSVFCLASIRRRLRLGVVRLACLSIAATLIGIGLARNALLVGNWRGGNEKAVVHPVADILHDVVIAGHELVFGGLAIAKFGPFEAIFVAATVVVAGAVVIDRQLQSGLLAELRTGTVEILVAAILVYIGAMAYVSLTSVISFGSRMFFPLLPIGLLIVGVTITKLQSQTANSRHKHRLAMLALCSLALAYGGINAQSFLEKSWLPPHQRVEQQMRGVHDGESLFDAIRQHIGSGDAIVSNKGQAAGYVLQRPVVSLVAQEYSTQVWDESAVKGVLTRYGAQYLILFNGDNKSAPELGESRFLSTLMMGRTPAWLELVLANGEVKVFRRRDVAR